MTMSDKNKAVIAMGSNIGDRRTNFDTALAILEKEEGIRILKFSKLYMTAPVGYVDQEWFLNSAIEIETTLLPTDLLKTVKQIESVLGRNFEGPRFGPRILDLDILLYQDTILQLPELEIPHPRLHERKFVLAPVCDIVPEQIHPILQKTMWELLQQLPAEGQEIKRVCC